MRRGERGSLPEDGSEMTKLRKGSWYPEVKESVWTEGPVEERMTEGSVTEEAAWEPCNSGLDTQKLARCPRNFCHRRAGATGDAMSSWKSDWRATTLRSTGRTINLGIFKEAPRYTRGQSLRNKHRFLSVGDENQALRQLESGLKVGKEKCLRLRHQKPVVYIIENLNVLQAKVSYWGSHHSREDPRGVFQTEGQVQTSFISYYNLVLLRL